MLLDRRETQRMGLCYFLRKPSYKLSVDILLSFCTIYFQPNRISLKCSDICWAPLPSYQYQSRLTLFLWMFYHFIETGRKGHVTLKTESTVFHSFNFETQLALLFAVVRE